MKHTAPLTIEQANCLSYVMRMTDAGELQGERVTVNEQGTAHCLHGLTGHIAGKRVHKDRRGRVYEETFIIVTDRPWKSGNYMSESNTIGLNRYSFNTSEETATA